MSLVRMFTFALLLTFIPALAFASDADELRERAHAIRREAAELAEAGRVDAAERLEREANAMLEKAEQLSNVKQTEARQLEALLGAIRQKERHLVEHGAEAELLDNVRHQAREVEAKLRMLHGEHPEPNDIERRLDHMRAAVEHLNHAGLHEIAEHVAEHAKNAERELHRPAHHPEADVLHELMKQLHELRHEVGRLRDEMNELRQNR